VVTRALADDQLEALRTIADVWTPPHDHTLSREELLAALAGAQVVICTLHDRIDHEALEAAGDALGLVSTISAGTDHLDLAALSQRGIGVANTPGALTAATADLTIGLMLAVMRRIAEGDRVVRAGMAWRWDLGFMLGDSPEGATLGIIGFGQIGKAVAHRARAFGMTVLASPSHSGARRDEIETLELDDLVRTADVISLHCPLNPDTHHLIDERRLGLMKPTAYLINTARGPIVDEAALARALASGALRGAGLDVYEEEPRVHADLLDLPNVVLAPHLGSANATTRRAMIDQAVASAREYILQTAARAPGR
jgi:glyoxylate reductase